MVNHTEFGNIAVGHKESVARALNNCEYLLDSLADAHAQMALLRSEIAALKDAVLTPEIKAQLAAIDAEFEDRIAAGEERIKALESEVKAAALTVGETVKGSRMQAVWAKPRVTWDAKALDGYAMNVPELFAFRKEGEPSVSIRWNKGK